MKHITTVALCTLWPLATAALAAQTATSAPHDTADTKADPAPLPAGFKLTGFAAGSYANPNWSEGNQFIFVENFTALGVSVETKFNNSVDAQFRVINGWDQVSDNNTHKSLMGRVGIYPDPLTSIGIVGFWGPEEVGNNKANRYGGEGLLWRKLGQAAVWVQADYGTEQANAALPEPARDAAWGALGGWVTYGLSTALC